MDFVITSNLQLEATTVFRILDCPRSATQGRNIIDIITTDRVIITSILMNINADLSPSLLYN